MRVDQVTTSCFPLPPDQGGRSWNFEALGWDAAPLHLRACVHYENASAADCRDAVSGECLFICHDEFERPLMEGATFVTVSATGGMQVAWSFRVVDA